MIVHALERRVVLNPFRGILMIGAAGIAFWRGWQIGHGHYAWMAYGLGLLALGLAAWHLAHGDRRHRS
jgi:Zn-dependent protease